MKVKYISKKLKKGLLIAGLTATCIIPASAISILSVVSCSNSAPSQPGGGSNRWKQKTTN